MRPLRYFINLTVDGCCDHRAFSPNEEVHLHAAGVLARADFLLYGRITYQMMEQAWRSPPPESSAPWMASFAEAMDAARKYVVSRSLREVDWNAELLRGDLGEAVERLKQGSGKGILVGGVQLPLALEKLGLIDEYEFLVHPNISGHGPTLLAGLSTQRNLELVGSRQLSSGAVALEYRSRG